MASSKSVVLLPLLVVISALLMAPCVVEAQLLNNIINITGTVSGTVPCSFNTTLSPNNTLIGNAFRSKYMHEYINIVSPYFYFEYTQYCISFNIVLYAQIRQCNCGAESVIRLFQLLQQTQMGVLALQSIRLQEALLLL